MHTCLNYNRPSAQKNQERLLEIWTAFSEAEIIAKLKAFTRQPGIISSIYKYIEREKDAYSIC